MKRYETVIGLEVHVELSTASKIFCACSTKFGDKPNSNCCPICMGMPGTLPSLNKRVVEHAIAVGVALNCSIVKNSMLDRKHYFYPDLTKAYQISQLYFPIARSGRLAIDTDNGEKIIGIHELHIEEDAGRLIHDTDRNKTLVDYNRSGVPLIEIVSEPDLRSADEVETYIDKLRTMLMYMGVSDCKLQEGSMRVDLNISVRELGDTRLGSRTEIKNMNSLRAISRAIKGESRRQIDILKSGGTIALETRRWDDNENESVRMRVKEDVFDYRYFTEPDIPPMRISDEWINKLRDSLPEFRDEKIIRYQKDYGISVYDAKILTCYREIADLFDGATKLCNLPNEVSNWLIVEGMRILKENHMDPSDICLTPEGLSKLILMIEQGRINLTKAKEVFEEAFLEGIDPEEFVKKHGLEMISDEKLLRATVLKILDDNPQAVYDYKNGRDKAFGNLVGQTMRAMNGRANPMTVNIILKEMLE